MSKIEGYSIQNGEPTPDNPAEIKSLDIEKDIKFIDEMIKEYNTFGDLDNPDYEDTDRIYKAIENILKRIQELEKENTTLKNFTSSIYNENIEKEFIPVQKVKEKIKEAKYNKKVGNTAYEYTEEDVWDIVKDELEELLEDK